MGIEKIIRQCLGKVSQYISLSMVVAIDKENYGFRIFCTSNKQAFAKTPIIMHSYCCINAVTLLNVVKSVKIQSIVNFITQILFTNIKAVKFLNLHTYVHKMELCNAKTIIT